MKRYPVILSAATVLAGLTAPANASINFSEHPSAPTVNRMVEGKRVTAPFAYLVFCRKAQSECRKGKTTGVAQMNKARWKELRQVNTRFNRSIQPVSDLDQYGKIDVWRIGVKRGDCEDYAMSKRQQLIAKGWSPSNLLLSVILDTKGGPHAVTIVRTSEGDFILDNLTSKIRKWDVTGYTYLKRQSVENPRIWMSVLNGSPQPFNKTIVAATPPPPKAKPKTKTIAAAAPPPQPKPKFIPSVEVASADAMIAGYY